MQAAAIDEAKKVLSDNFVTQAPVPIYDIARKSGLRIEVTPFPTKFSHIQGFITKDNSAYTMYVNANDSEGERNFTIAHELGHWKLHKSELEKDLNKSVLFRLPLAELNKDPLEDAANEFAASLLIPDDILKQNEGKSPSDLARIFGVSEDVIGYRLKLLEEQAETQDVVQEEKGTSD